MKLKPGGWELSADYKVDNSGVGIMAHAARFGCNICKYEKGSGEHECVLRTFEGIAEDNQRWIDAGSVPSTLKEFFNCRSKPLPFFPPVGYVRDYVPPSSLHLTLGIVNHGWNNMKQKYPGCTEWRDSLNIRHSDYHGASFEGRECIKLLENVNVLERIVRNDDDTRRIIRFDKVGQRQRARERESERARE